MSLKLTAPAKKKIKFNDKGKKLNKKKKKKSKTSALGFWPI